jgi:hypothetical protein
MKKKKINLNQKIFLQKEVVANLTESQQHSIHGGGRTLYASVYTLPNPVNCLCCAPPLTVGCTAQ